jgi:membrane protease YdiL (CAAX protease family)
MLLPFFILFPAFVFSSKVKVGKDYDWLDFTIFVIFLLPITLITLETKSEIPFDGNGFDSFYRIMILITAVYAFVVVRGVKDVGFFPEFQLKKLWRAIWVWLLFYSSIFIFAVSVNFLKYKGHDVVDSALFLKIFKKLLTTFLHVALFEELFFRGLLQNMLQKRISQSSNWKMFWLFAAGILFSLSLATGYLMDGGMSYFPALVSLLLFVAAWFIEKAKFDKTGTYTALAISSVIFGLVHYHSGSIIFVGLAAIGGWAYGYTYIKTKNVFYAALVHTLVNTSALMFGLDLAK